MVAIKAGSGAAFMKSPPAKIGAVLFYGTDPGMVSERARMLAATLAARDDPPGEIIRIGDSDLDDGPDRLLVELQTIPMFGGRQVVRTVASRRVTAATLKSILTNDGPANYLIIEAGNLKPTDGLRKLFEKPSFAAGVACFPDSVRDLDAMITEVLAAAKLSISREAKALLTSRLGADRSLSRGEIEKLALYAMDRKTIEIADIDAMIGDASELAMDKIILSAAAGNSALSVRSFDRSVAGGDSPQGIILAASRHFQRLHRARSALEAGRSLDDAMRAMRPPVHFKQKDAFAAQVRNWSADKLAHALTRISATAKAARLNAALEATLAERLLMELAHLGKR